MRVTLRNGQILALFPHNKVMYFVTCKGLEHVTYQQSCLTKKKVRLEVKGTSSGFASDREGPFHRTPLLVLRLRPCSRRFKRRSSLTSMQKKPYASRRARLIYATLKTIDYNIGDTPGEARLRRARPSKRRSAERQSKRDVDNGVHHPEYRARALAKDAFSTNKVLVRGRKHRAAFTCA